MTEAWEQWVGHTVDGQFHLRRYLGGSGNSAVFLTEYREPEPRNAALKLVPVSREKATRQLSRAQLGAQLSHPNLLRIFQVGLCQLGEMSLLYIVMEYADEDLSRVIPQRALSSSEARDILVPALDVLAYLHREGFVHGHLKPANILAVDYQVKIAGDLLSRIGDEGLSPADDVWSLGVTLVEALTQRREWPADLPAPFFDIAQHCLEKNPRRRWTVARISESLNPAAVKPREPQRKWLYFAAPLLAVLLVAILAGPRLLSRRGQPVVVQPQPVTSERAAESAQSAAAPASFRPVPSIKASAPPTDPPAGIVHQVSPEVPGKASNTIHGKVKIDVELSVDPSGSVLDAKLDPPVQSRYFGDLALQAAQRWKFAPSDGPDKWILRFEFVRGGTKVSPERISP